MIPEVEFATLDRSALQRASVKQHSVMCRVVVWVTGFLFLLMLLFAAAEFHALRTAESRGTTVAVLPATQLGFDLRTFKGPSALLVHGSYG